MKISFSLKMTLTIVLLLFLFGTGAGMVSAFPDFKVQIIILYLFPGYYLSRNHAPSKILT
jgi:hypothetical protein